VYGGSPHAGIAALKVKKIYRGKKKYGDDALPIPRHRSKNLKVKIVRKGRSTRLHTTFANPFLPMTFAANNFFCQYLFAKPVLPKHFFSNRRNFQFLFKPKNIVLFFCQLEKVVAFAKRIFFYQNN